MGSPMTAAVFIKSLNRDGKRQRLLLSGAGRLTIHAGPEYPLMAAIKKVTRFAAGKWTETDYKFSMRIMTDLATKPKRPRPRAPNSTK